VCEQPYTRAELEKLTKDLLGIAELPFQIKRQIREFTERGYSYKGVARALCYLVDVKHLDLRAGYQQFGIGIVKNVYNEAQSYFEKLRQEKEKQLQRQQEMILAANNEAPTIICGISDSKKKIKKKAIDISAL
jgi:hypothetical protein